MNYLRLNAEDLFHFETSGCLYTPEIISPASAQARYLGEQFHLIMQQSLMDMTIDSLLNNHPQLKQWFSQLQLLAPEIWSQQANTWKAHSHRSEYFYDNVILASNFDLLIYGYEQLEIVNWTTDTQFNLTEGEWYWRTQLDLFLMAQTDTYLPEQIRLTYWLLNHPTHPIKVSIHYSSQALLAFKVRLAQTLSKLSVVLSEVSVASGKNGNNQHDQNPLSTLTLDERTQPQLFPKEIAVPKPVPEANAFREDSLSQFLSGKLSLREYIDSVPELEL